DEDLKAFQFLWSKGQDLSREAVARGVERGALFPFLGARPGRFLRVQAIGAKPGFGQRAADGGWGIGRSFAGARWLACGRILFGRHEDPLAVRIGAGGKRTEGGSGGSC